MTRKKTRLIALLLGAALLFSSLLLAMPSLALAAEGDTGTTDIWEWKELADGTLEIYTCTSPSGSLTLPDKLDIDPSGTVDERDVTRIGIGAFGMASGITVISLPSTLTSIGENAFISCTGLTSITIPASVSTIGSYAFGSCDNLETVTLQDGLQALSTGAFSGCTSLTAITVPDTVTVIGSAAFSSCANLESITLPSNPAFTVLSNNLFDSCTSLESILIPESVTSIQDNVFANTGITSITIPENVSFIGELVFAPCPNLTAFQVSPSNIHFVAVDGVLYNAARTSLLVVPNATTGTFSVPAGVTDIAMGAFVFCTNLTEVVLTDDVQTIGMFAFGYSGITSITIPENVTDIGMAAFAQCPELERAVIMSRTANLGANLFMASGIGGDGIYGFAGSTAQTYATANSHPFHLLYTVSFNAGEGSAVRDLYVESGHSFAAPTNPIRNGFLFTGWYTDEACTDLWDFDTDTVTDDMELHAGWAPVLTLAAAPSNSQIYVGGRVTIMPNIIGGEWEFDETLLSRSGNEFKALKAGPARVTYTAGAQTAFVDVTILDAELPATGQDFSPVLWLLVLAALAGGVALATSIIRYNAMRCEK